MIWYVCALCNNKSTSLLKYLPVIFGDWNMLVYFSFLISVKYCSLYLPYYAIADQNFLLLTITYISFPLLNHRKFWGCTPFVLSAPTSSFVSVILKLSSLWLMSPGSWCISFLQWVSHVWLLNYVPNSVDVTQFI
jgi:hypothetical protein